MLTDGDFCHDDAVFSLSDVLVAVTDNSTQYNISGKMAEAGFTSDKDREFLSAVATCCVFLFLCCKMLSALLYP